MSRQTNLSGMMVEVLEERRMMSVASFGTSLIHPDRANLPRLDQSIIADNKLARADNLKKTLASKRIASPQSQVSQSAAKKSTSSLKASNLVADKSVRPHSTTSGIKLDEQTVSEDLGAGKAPKSPRKPAHHAKPKPAHPKQRHRHVVQDQEVSYPAADQGDDPFEQSGFEPASSDQVRLGPTNEPNASGAANWVDESGNPLFGPNGPSPDDIYQGGAGRLLFPGNALFRRPHGPRPDRAGRHEPRRRELSGGFLQQRRPVDQVVDGYLPVDGNGKVMYAQFGQDNSVWVPIVEKAFANYRSAINGNAPDYANINYGVAEEVFGDVGANNINGLGQGDIPDGQTLFNDAAQELAAGQAVTFETPNDPNAGPLVSNHLYSVVSVYQSDDGSYELELRNPYGNDGPNGDGYNWIDADTAQGQLYDLASANV